MIALQPERILVYQEAYDGRRVTTSPRDFLRMVEEMGARFYSGYPLHQKIPDTGERIRASYRNGEAEFTLDFIKGTRCKITMRTYPEANSEIERARELITSN